VLDAHESGRNTDSMIEDAIGVLHSPAGTSPLGLLDVDMLPGRDYTIICTLANDDKSRPHVILGMQGTIRVIGARANAVRPAEVMRRVTSSSKHQSSEIGRQRSSQSGASHFR